MPFKPPKTLKTYIEIGSVEVDVEVEFDYSPSEPDVNAGERVEVNTVCILSELTTRELKEIEEKCLQEVHNKAEAYYEGDG